MGNDDSPRPGFTHWVAMPGQGEAIDPHLNVDGQRLQAKGYVTDVLTDYVERFVEGAKGQPFLAYLAHKAIHPNVIQQDDGRVVPMPGQPGGFVAAERHRGRYAGHAAAAIAAFVLLLFHLLAQLRLAESGRSRRYVEPSDRLLGN